jgi:4-carboxymuconolactone decarboxylase
VTRISIINRAEMNDEQGRVYDEAKAAGGPVGGPYWAYIRNPKLMRSAQDLTLTMRSTKLSGRERQIAVLAVARFWGAKYPWAAQVRASLAAGVDQATIDAINMRKDPNLGNPREKMALKLAQELLVDHGLSSATYEAAEKLFGVEDLVALVATVGQFCMTCCTANAFDITPTEEMPGRLAG